MKRAGRMEAWAWAAENATLCGAHKKIQRLDREGGTYPGYRWNLDSTTAG